MDEGVAVDLLLALQQNHEVLLLGQQETSQLHRVAPRSLRVGTAIQRNSKGFNPIQRQHIILLYLNRHFRHLPEPAHIDRLLQFVLDDQQGHELDDPV